MQKFTSIIKAFLMSLVLIGFSCTDHDFQELPDVETLVYGNNCKTTFAYNLNVRNIGTQPVKEYGIVIKRGKTIEVPDLPTVADTKVIFPNPIKLGPITYREGGDCWPVVYYRSYVMLESGVVVYGNYIRFLDV